MGRPSELTAGALSFKAERHGFGKIVFRTDRQLFLSCPEVTVPSLPGRIIFSVLHGFVCKTLREEGKEINLTGRKKKLSSL